MHAAPSSSISSSSEVTNYGWQAWLVCLTAALFFFYEFIQGFVFNTMASDVMREFHLNAEQLGWLTGIYFIANMVFLFAAGALLDRFSTRQLILGSLALCILGTFYLGYCESYSIALGCRFLTGIGSAFCFLACIRLASRWFDSARMAFVTGMVVTMAMFGGMVAQTPMSFLVESVGWRQALIYDGFLGIAIFSVIWFVVKDFPHDKSRIHETEQQNLATMGVLESMRQSYFKLQNIFPAVYTSLMNAPLVVLGGMVGGLFLQQTQGLSATQASYVASMLFIGTIIGGPTVGWISDKLKRRRMPMLIGALLSLNVLFILLKVPTMPLEGWAMMFFAMGLLTSTQVLSYPILAENNPPEITATAVSCVSILTQGGAALIQPFFGNIMSRAWNGEEVDGVAWYSLADYQHAFYYLIGGLIMAFAAMMLTKAK